MHRLIHNHEYMLLDVYVEQLTENVVVLAIPPGVVLPEPKLRNESYNDRAPDRRIDTDRHPSGILRGN